jgi:hypothetical protein
MCRTRYSESKLERRTTERTVSAFLFKGNWKYTYYVGDLTIDHDDVFHS